jgi:hypothetical protein
VYDQMPDWMRPMTEAELFQEAMDYEFNAQYDQYDGFKEEFIDDADYREETEAGFFPQPEAFYLPLREHIPYDPATDDVPF